MPRRPFDGRNASQDVGAGARANAMSNVKTIACAAALGLAFAGSALAQQTSSQQSQPSGTTSGPASGSNVEPSAATQKKAGVPNSGAVSAGAPGAEAEKGSESGQKPK